MTEQTEFTVGIYSFPKSGNTWIRTICVNVLDIPKTSKITDGLYLPDIHKNQPLGKAVEVYGNKYYLYKSHTAHEVSNISGQPIKNDVIIHIRRNPLDVFLSYMNFQSSQVTNNAIHKFESVDAIHGTKLFNDYFSAFTILGSMDRFIATSRGYIDSNLNWVTKASETANSSRIFCVKYEDMLEDLPKTLSPIFERLKVPKAVYTNALTNMRKPEINGKFFWKMKSGYYTEYLSKDQIQHYLELNEEALKVIGYYDDIQSALENI